MSWVATLRIFRWINLEFKGASTRLDIESIIRKQTNDNKAVQKGNAYLLLVLMWISPATVEI